MFGQPDRFEPQFLGILNLFDGFLQDAALMRGSRFRPGRENKQAKFHTLVSSCTVLCSIRFIAIPCTLAMHDEYTPPPAAASRGWRENGQYVTVAAGIVPHATPSCNPLLITNVFSAWPARGRCP